MPQPTTTNVPEPVRACVGDTVFLPSFFPVSGLANDVEVTWFRVIGGITRPADNGMLITANYSYKLDNVTMSDAGQYFARVEVPSGEGGQGPIVTFAVEEKPGRFPKTCHNVHHVHSVQMELDNVYLIQPMYRIFMCNLNLQ